MEKMRDEFIILPYDTNCYPFQSVLEKYVFKVSHLSQLHRVWKKQTGKDLLKYKDNLILRKVMQNLPDDSLFYQVYHQWIAKVLAPHYYNKISYSKHPKMRVHLAGTGCVSDFHCDADVTGRLDQINCYLPFTDVYDGSTVWYETGYGTNTYRPFNLKYGQALLWDGGCLKHGTYRNNTDNTRVSCDFRFHAKIPEHVKRPWCNILAKRPIKIPPISRLA